MFAVHFAIVCGCQPHADNVKESNLIRKFFQEMSSEEREREFKKYSLAEQYDLYIWGNQVVHPPAMYLAIMLAEEGPAIVPFFTEKLKDTTEELTIRDIASVLRYLAVLKQYDFSKDPALMELIDRRVHGMQGQWKDTTAGFVSEIRSVERRGGVSPTSQGGPVRANDG
jgi:hypothetical protein